MTTPFEDARQELYNGLTTAIGNNRRTVAFLNTSGVKGKEAKRLQQVAKHLQIVEAYVEEARQAFLLEHGL